MPYGTIKVDNITFTNAGVDQTVTVSGIVQSISGNITATGTIQGATIIGTSTVSGATVTGNAGLFVTATAATGVFTSQISGATVLGTTGSFTTLTGGSVTITSGLFASGTAAAPSVSIGTTTNGLYSSATNEVAISTNGTGRLTVDASGNIQIAGNDKQINPAGRLLLATSIANAGTTFRAIPNGTGIAAALQVGNNTDPSNQSVGSLSVNQTEVTLFSTVNGTGTQLPLLFNVGGERLRITTDGKVGLGTSNPFTTLHSSRSVTGGSPATSGTTDANVYARLQGGNVATDFGLLANGQNWIQPRDVNSFATNYGITLCPNGGNVGVGTTSPSSAIHASGSSGSIGLRVTSGSSSGEIAQNGTDFYVVNTANGPTQFWTNGSERARIDSSGRLLVGTSSPYAVSGFNRNTYIAPISGESDGQVVISATGAGTPGIFFTRTRGSTPTTYTVVQDGDTLGRIDFFGADGVDYSSCGARIAAQVDGTPGSDDLPSRLVFSTTADGASSPTERMRIRSDGGLVYGTGATPGSDITSGTGFWFSTSTGLFYIRSVSSPVAAFNRGTDDGTLVEFKQDQTIEGTISVSGTTVSYNGAHLSRWSQLPSGAERTEILRGTVLSNIDEMCEWGDEDNEQLNRMKVSDVEGDKNVSGVFQAWDNDDDTYTNDFYCAMTGDFIIRIAAGVTVERGDLLMSAGDGTAKPQDDDIIRSKTIAKVTSTNVSCTYPDGSYCVPCVLMAC